MNNQLQAYRSLVKYSLISIFKTPSAVIFSVAFPLVFIFVFGFLNQSNTGKLHIGYPNEMKEMLTPEIKSEFPSFVFENMDSSGTDREYLDIIINSKQSITIRKNTPNADLALVSLAKIDDHTPTPLPFSIQTIEPKKNHTIDFILPGQLGFALLASAVFGIAFLFFNLRQTMVLKRFFVTPVSKITILLSEATSRMIFQLFTSLLIILIGHWIFGFHLKYGLLTVLQILSVCALASLVFMGFGFWVSSLSKSEAMIAPISNLVTLPQFLLAGTFFPISSFPSWLQPVCRMMPLTYFNDAVRRIAGEGASLWDVRLDLAVLFVIGIIIYGFLPRFFKWES